MQNLTIIIPFYNGQRYIERLLRSLPKDVPVIVVDDVSDAPYQNNNLQVIRLTEKGYFAGAVNAGIEACKTDVLVLNQDTELTGTAWLDLLAQKRNEYSMIGERIAGSHPAWAHGYIHGTFMFMRRDAINHVGLLNGVDYPLWGNTCEWQLRAARAGYKVLPLQTVPGFVHHRKGGEGSSIKQLLYDQPTKRGLFIRTPPEVSVVVSCYNYGRYLPDLVNSLVGGETSLGEFPQQSFASFEVVIVDDASTDNSWEYCKQVADSWKGVRAIRLRANVGTAAANNAGIRAAHGKYISIMNADDMMEPGRLERLYRKQVENPHSFVYDGIVAFMDGERKPDMRFRVGKFDFEKILYRNHVHAGIMMPKKAWKDVGGYPEEFGDGREDWAINVALGIRGWCGVYIPKPGYLYRRERQNRTLINTSPMHHEDYLQRLVRRFPNVYGGERTNMCCDSGPTANNSQANSMVAKSAKMTVPGGAGTVLLEYQGRSHGTISYYGPVTGARYEAGLTKKIIAVDKRDLETSKGYGLLQIREDGKDIFKRYEPPKTEAPQANPEVLEETTAPIIEQAIDALDSLIDEVEKIAEGADPKEIYSLPKVSNMTVKEITALDGYTAEQWQVLLEAEQNGKARKTALEFLESKVSG